MRAHLSRRPAITPRHDAGRHTMAHRMPLAQRRCGLPALHRIGPSARPPRPGQRACELNAWRHSAHTSVGVPRLVSATQPPSVPPVWHAASSHSHPSGTAAASAPPPRALRPGSVWAASAVGSDSLPDPTAGGTVPAAAAWRGPAGPRAPPPPPADALAPPLAGAPHVRPRRPPMLAAARARRAGAGSRRVVWSPARCPRHRRVAVSVGGRARRHSAPGGGQAALPLGALV